MSYRQEAEDEYRIRMSDAALELRNRVHGCWRQSGVLLDMVNGAIAGADCGESPPDEAEMRVLWDEIGVLVSIANQARSQWRELNNSAQVWTVVGNRPHYFTDLTGGQG
jgi:hypothetical protein